MNLQDCATKESSTTGRGFVFVVETMKANGSNVKRETVTVVALATADAWRVIGEAIERFMDGPDGRMVNSVTLIR